MVTTTLISVLSLLVFSGNCRQHGLVYAQECPSPDEALLRVSYPVPSWKGGNKVEVFVTESAPKLGSTNITEMNGEYPSDETFVFEACIPRDDTCGHIAVRGLPKDLYEVSWDGQLLHTDVEVWSSWEGSNPKTLFTTRQFGEACVFTCENTDEAVFEIQHRNRPDDSFVAKPMYRLEDQNDKNKVIFSKDDLYLDAQAGLNVERMCLPKNNCYHLVMRNRFLAFEDMHLSLSFDNKVVFETGPFDFLSTEFGGDCSGSSRWSCDPELDSKIELFVSDSHSLPSTPLSWELKSMSSGSLIRIPVMQPTNDTITRFNYLEYHNVCVPKQSCWASSLIVPKDIDIPQTDYMLKVDDTIYRYETFWEDEKFLPETTYIGTCTKAVCGNTDSRLLQLDIQTISPDKWYTVSYHPQFNLKWMLSTMNSSSLFEDEDEEDPAPRFNPYDFWLARSFDFIKDYSFDSSYRIIQCIPNEECLNGLYISGADHFLSFQTGIETFSTKVDGVPGPTDNVTSYEGWDVFPLDNGCDFGSSGLSGGAIAGIVIACVVVGGAIIAFFVFRKKVDK